MKPLTAALTMVVQMLRNSFIAVEAFIVQGEGDRSHEQRGDRARCKSP